VKNFGEEDAVNEVVHGTGPKARERFQRLAVPLQLLVKTEDRFVRKVLGERMGGQGGERERGQRL
jgi:hypothetical protein